MFTISRSTTDGQRSDSSNGSRWLGFAWVFAFQCLLMALPTLKLLHLFGADSWSWRWITIPFWGPSALLALLLLVEHITGIRKIENQVQWNYQRNY